MSLQCSSPQKLVRGTNRDLTDKQASRNDDGGYEDGKELLQQLPTRERIVIGR
jgi:hypothetical protein